MGDFTISGFDCPYIKCQLPESNRKYFYQAVYLVISFFLLFEKDQFSAITLLMYVAPVMLDIVYFDSNANMSPKINRKVKINAFKIIKGIYALINTYVLILSFLGICEVFIFESDGTILVSKSSLIFKAETDISFLFNPIVFILIADILFSFIMYFGSPCKEKVMYYRYSNSNHS